MTIDRRSFLFGAAALPLRAVRPFGVWLPRGDDRVLVVLELEGGNDGLNTVIPLDDERYARARPRLSAVRQGAHVLADGLRAPLAGVDGRQHIHANGGRAKDEIPFGRDVAGIVNDNRYHGHAGLHCQMKSTFFERRQSRRHGAGALGRQYHGFTFLFHLVNQRLHRLDRTAGVGAIDQYHAAHLQYPADQRIFLLDFLFADCRDIAAQEPGNDDHIRLALVVEHKDGRAM